MSWEIVKEATDLLLTKSIIKDLEFRLMSKEIFSKKTNWLKSSNYALNTISKNVYGNKVKKDLLKAVYYLRCSYYWKRKDMDLLENELTNVIFEYFPEEAIFNLIQGSIYLRKVTENLKLNVKNKKMIAENLNLSYLFLNKALKQTNDSDIIVAISWTLVWMYHLSGKKEELMKEIVKIKKIEGINIGKGWALWLTWLGNDLEEDEILFLTKKL